MRHFIFLGKAVAAAEQVKAKLMHQFPKLNFWIFENNIEVNGEAIPVIRD